MVRRLTDPQSTANRVRSCGNSMTQAWRLGLGTLGGGNHFIEIRLDEVNRVWLMLHSGNRMLGAAIGEHFA